MDLKRVLSFPPYPGDYLHPVVYACTAVMLLCMLVSIVTYLVHYSVIRISRNGWHTLLNFLFHTALTFGVFAGGINQIKYPFVCQVVGIVLHYASLSTMLWMTFTARNICKDVSKVPPQVQDRDTPKQPKSKPTILRFYLVSDGVPLIIVGVTAAVSMENYGSRDDALYCWMAWEPSLGGFYGPAALLVLVMCVYFLCAFVQLKRHPERKYELRAMTEEQQRLAEAAHHCHGMGGGGVGGGGGGGEEGGGGVCPGFTSGGGGGGVSVLANEHSFKAQLRATAFTLFLFLATWALGALAVSQGHFLDMVFSCLYGAFSVTLGLFLLIQHCAKRDDVWHRWWACCPAKPRQPNQELLGGAEHGRHHHGHHGHHGGHHHHRHQQQEHHQQGHCHMDSPCSGKQPLLSPHLLHGAPATHYKMPPTPLSPVPNNHTGGGGGGPCCMAVHGPVPSPVPLLLASDGVVGGCPSPRQQQNQLLPDELPRPAPLPLQSCLKDRTKSRSFNRPRPCLRDYHYHMASTSMDGSIHSSSHLDSPHSVTGDRGVLGGGVCHSPHPADLQLPCPSPHLDKQTLAQCPGMHNTDTSCHGLSTHHDGGLSSSVSCHVVSHGGGGGGGGGGDESHTCHRHMCCPPKADPFTTMCYPTPKGTGVADPFSLARLADPDTYRCGREEEEEEEGGGGMLHHLGMEMGMGIEMEMEMEGPQAGRQTLSRPPHAAATLSRRGTISRHDSLQEDFLFGSSDGTGNIRTGPWKNETTV